MANCCQAKSCDLQPMAQRHSRVLWTVLAINGLMFFVEMVAGVVADSTALQGDSLDMLGDAIAYGSSLFAVNRGLVHQYRSSMLKGILMLVVGASIFGRAIYEVLEPELPGAATMTWVGLAALVANGWCLALLSRHRNDGINMKSVWLCSRNDIIANISVLAAAWAVAKSQSPWPDLIVGFLLSILFVNSAVGVLRDAAHERRLAGPVA